MKNSTEKDLLIQKLVKKNTVRVALGMPCTVRECIILTCSAGG